MIPIRIKARPKIMIMQADLRTSLRTPSQPLMLPPVLCAALRAATTCA